MYEGFRRDPSWFRPPAPGYLDATVADLAQLAPDLKTEAILIDQFEASWPQPLLARVIDDLASLDRPIRHLYYVNSDSVTQQVANAMEDDVDVCRHRMLEAVHYVPANARGAIIWGGEPLSQ